MCRDDVALSGNRFAITFLFRAFKLMELFRTVEDWDLTYSAHHTYRILTSAGHGPPGVILGPIVP
eukprot:19036-Heterococcus_DN1.PRE.4